MTDNNNEWMGKALESESQVDYLRKEIELLSTSNYDKVRIFQKTFYKVPPPDHPTIPDENSKLLAMKNIAEEFQEVLEQLGYQVEISVTNVSSKPVDLPKLAKELADLLVVTYGAGSVFGINMDEVFDAVNESNMSKLDKNGKPVYRDDGKVLKSELYSEPDIESIIENQRPTIRRKRK